MTIKVVTDSGCDIPRDIREELDITVVPLTVTFGSTSYQDGVDLSSDEFYERLVGGSVMPTTSQPSVGSFVETYSRLRESADQLLSIHVSSKLSGTLNSASQAVAQENLSDSVQLVDSQSASMGLGFSVMAAAEAVKQGASLEEATSAAYSALERTELFILFDTLKYLEKGGRIGKASALLGSVLQLKPILTLENGEIATKAKIRTFRKGIQSLEQLSQECGNLENVAVLYTTDADYATSLAEQIEQSSNTPLVVRISPAIGTHGGPGVIGIVCVKSER